MGNELKLCIMETSIARGNKKHLNENKQLLFSGDSIFYYYEDITLLLQ